MRGLDVPDREDDFTADPVELFFDLAYVFAFSQLVSHLVHHPSWTGFGEASLLFLLLWFAWSTFTWTANSVSGNARNVRLIFLVATAVMVPVAASVSTAFDAGGSTFALFNAVILLMGVGVQLMTSNRTAEEFRAIVTFAAPVVAAAIVLILGGFVGGAGRVWIWIAALLIMFGSTVAAGGGDWVVRTGHFAERHGLIIIIALGEVIVAIGIAVVGSLEADGMTGSTRVALVAAGALAGLMWWAYFDRVLPGLEHRGEAIVGADRGLYARDIYTYGHVPIVGGIILTAAAAEELLLHPDAAPHVEFRVMLAAGLAMYMCGVVFAAFRAFKVIPPERLVGAAAIAVLALVGSSLDGVVLLVAVDVLLAATLVVEHMRIER